MKHLIKTYFSITSLSWVAIENSKGFSVKEIILKFINSDLINEIWIVLVTGSLVIITQQILSWVRRKLSKSKLEKEVIKSVIDEVDEIEKKIKEKIESWGDKE